MKLFTFPSNLINFVLKVQDVIWLAGCSWCYTNRVQFKLKGECCYCCCCWTDGQLVRPLQYKKVINVMRPDFRFLIYIRSIYSPTMMAKRVKTMTTRGREHSVSRIHFSFCLDIYFFSNNQNCSNKIDWEERAREIWHFLAVCSILLKQKSMTLFSPIVWEKYRGI